MMDGRMKYPRWKIIHIGCLRKNRYWDEEEDRRPQSCTVSLIETESRRILVDPGLSSPEELWALLDRRAGIVPEDIDTVFLTHFHRHHRHCLLLFAKSVWLMPRTEIHWWERRKETTEEERDLLARIVPIEDHTLHEIEILPTPGHTHGSASLVVETREGMVVIAGDAVATFDHFEDCEPAEGADDIKEARRSIDRIAKIADIVVPGHDNYFVL